MIGFGDKTLYYLLTQEIINIARWCNYINVSCLWAVTMRQSNYQSRTTIARRGISGVSCWRHQMETFSALLAICAGNSPVTNEFPTQRPVTRSIDVFYAWINGWVNNGEAGDLRCHRAHYDVTVMIMISPLRWKCNSMHAKMRQSVACRVSSMG